MEDLALMNEQAAAQAGLSKDALSTFSWETAHDFGERTQNIFAQSYENALNRIYNANEAEKNRQFEKMMSDSAYSRAIADLKSAGINPLYLFMGSGGQASTPSGAAGSSSPANMTTARKNKDTWLKLLSIVLSFAKLLGSGS